jgi:hypothetical protein
LHFPNFASASRPFIFFPVRFWAYASRMLHAIDTFLGAPDCAHYFIFAGYVAFMWGIVGTANFLDAANSD